jgi:hypothetical protein
LNGASGKKSKNVPDGADEAIITDMAGVMTDVIIPSAALTVR